ncbi:MAG: hypothetical protein JST04_04805 [Bdellovibrionales bacterium]|nr:hypothetical protein [Bdellovibrionales bacterium]
MDAWVYLFSKFTHEALLFESLAIFLGLFGYAVFYLIRKRKYGVAGKEVPSNVMKAYLAQLVGDAEEIRTQLFGLLGKGEASARLMANLQFQADLPTTGAPAPGAGATLAGAPVTTTQLVQDPKLAEKLKELEKKLADQAGALDSVLNEKMKLEEELANAKSRSTGDDGKSPDKAGPDRAGPLQERVKQLEAQLAEYAIIEDDLANLKRLQKENKTLKQQLADAGASPAPAAAAPEVPELAAAPKPATAKAAEEPAPEAAAPEMPSLEAAAAAEAVAAPDAKAAPTKPAMPDLSGPNDPDIATEAVDSPHASGEDHPADFESLVDVVEKNLADAAKSENVDPTAAPTPEFQLESGPASETKPDEKSEEQLQADFEKMLKS